MRLFTVLLFSFVFAGCSSLNPSIEAGSKTQNPLKSTKDIEIERALSSGTWTYQRLEEDCKDTQWKQTFHTNRYYKSVGDACLIPDAFSVDAESWHIKKQILYVTNLSPLKGEDIILKYRIDFLDESKLVLASGEYKYTFTK